MADDLENLVLRVGLEVDDEDYKKAKEELKKMQSTATSNGKNIGVGSASNITNTDEYNKLLLETLMNSEEYLRAIYDLLRSSKSVELKNKQISENLEEEIREDKTRKSEDNSPGLGLLASGFGGLAAPETAGLSLIAGFVMGKIGDSVVKSLDTIMQKVEEKFTREMDLQKLSYLTGKSAEELYRLSTQAELAGSSLKEIREAGKSIAQELLFGMSDQKVMLYQSLGINPVDLLKKANWDFTKLPELVDKAFKSSSASKNLPQQARSLFEASLGIPEGIQPALANINRQNIKEQTDKIISTRGNIGRNEEWRTQYENFMGSRLRLRAASDKLYSTPAFEKLSASYIDMKTNVVNLSAGTITGIENLINKLNPSSSSSSRLGNNNNINNNSMIDSTFQFLNSGGGFPNGRLESNKSAAIKTAGR